MGVPAGRQLDGAAGREAGTDERVESGLTTFLTHGVRCESARPECECGRTTSQVWSNLMLKVHQFLERNSSIAKWEEIQSLNHSMSPNKYY
jgi:hypothetical protein